MAILRPAEYQHTNPAYAIADSNFVRGGIRTGVADLTALYALDPTPSAPDQFKENATIVYVSGETAYYVLVDINNIGNANGWEIFNSGGGASNLSGATNGLSLYSGNTYVGLGGTLNQNTCIDGAGGAYSTCFIDTQFVVSGASSINLRSSLDKTIICSSGVAAGSLYMCAGSVDIKLGGANAFAYLTDCSANYDCLSIPNVGWVTGQTVNLGAANGLSKVGSNIVLGGTLTGNTCVDSATNSLVLSGTNRIDNYISHQFTPSCSGLIHTSYDCITLHHDANASCSQEIKLYNGNACMKTGSATVYGSLALQDGLGTLLTASGNKCAYVQANAGTLTTNMVVTSGTCYTWLCQQHNAITVRSYLNPSFGGIKYYDNYGTNFTARSLVDKAYVTGLTCQAVISANNGLTKSGTNVRLGGNLTGNTTIGSVTSHYNLVLGTSTNYLDCLNSDACCIQLTARDALALVANSGGKSLNFNSSGNGICVADNTSYGLLYGGDYETNFCPRSLITKQYLTSQISGITSCAITSANNGLTKSGQNVRLGGSLTGDTTITGAATHAINLGTSGAALASLNAVTPIFTVEDAGGNSYMCFNHDAASPYFTTYLNDTATGNVYGGIDLYPNSNTRFQVYTDSDNPNTYAEISLGVMNDNGGTNWGVQAQNSGLTYNQRTILNHTGTNMFFCESIQDSSNSALNIKFAGCYVDRSFTFSKNNTSVLSILSGGTARYGVATTAACITNDADLANKIYVDTCVNSLTGTTSVAITGATNGLCKVGQNVVLGGALTGNTCIDIASSTFRISHTGDDSCIALSPSEARMMIGCVSQGYNAVVLTPTSLGLVSQSGGTNASMNLQYGTGNITFVNNGTLKTTHTTSGLYYNSNFGGTGGSNPRWIPDNAYVTGLTSQAILTANNGLCKVGTNVCLGGALVAPVTITTGSNLFKLCGGNGNYFQENINTLSWQVSGATGCVYSTASGTGTYSLSSTNGSNLAYLTISPACSSIFFNSASLQICANCATFSDGNNSQGLVYGGNYEGNFVPRSLVTKQYVVDCVNSLTGITSTAITGATNGLTETSNHNVVLGGNLTGATNIDNQGNSFGLYGSGAISIGSNGATTLCGSSILARTSDMAWWSVTSFDKCACFKDTGIGFDHTSGVTFCGAPAKYDINYCSSYTPRSLVDREYVDKSVTGSSNAVSVCIVSANYTGTTESAFIGVTGATDICVWLPPTPKLGQRVSVADVCTGALSYPICVIGNGRNINGSAYATINTDFGSITFINNGFTWSAVSFIN